MPWRGSDDPKVYPTLGYTVAEWIEAHCVVPDGILQGQPFRLTDEMLRFLLRYYRLHPNAIYEDFRPSAPFFFRGALLMRPQKWGKGPFAAAVCLAEAFGPVQFDGWDAAGEPVGRPWATPLIQIVANSEEQTDNTWLALTEMASRGPLADTSGVDWGIQDINLPNGGKIEPRSASARSRLGGRLTFGLLDETGLMVQSSGGVQLANTMKRGASGMSGRWMETSNAYDPTEQSVAQRTHESAATDVLIDYRPATRRPDFSNDEDCLELLGEVYGDSFWVDPIRILADARDPGVCSTEADALRFFFNLITVGVSDVVDPTIWASLARERDLQPGEAICLGFDGSRTMDWTALMASRLEDGRLFHMGSWDPATYDDHRIPRHEVDAIVTAAFEAYDVRFLYMDPFYWQDYRDLWASRWPDQVVTFETNQPKRMDRAISRFLAAVKEGLTHDGNPDLADHVNAAALAKGGRKRPRPEEDPSIVQNFWTITKKRTGHIDLLVAGIEANEARGEAIAVGMQPLVWRPL